MSDIRELLAAEAERREPAQAPAFAELLTARARRRRRGAALGVVAAVAAVVGGSAQIADDVRPPDRPGIVREPLTNAPGATVSGTLRQVGGPMGTQPHGVAGTVHFQAVDGSVLSAEVAGDGRFSLSIPAGRYRVTGTRAGHDTATCRTRDDVVVPDGGLDGVDVGCHVR
ncbi:hypothetical protein QLQ12_00200 [Actinoplanes sp. NEAU-A12]|uniref:Carboxypeptidase regulatory-like domain-containing protein n=1 Tax=Actinoplanes sandaracinus TaxID=3045177 RepID=A0ABT6WBC1_9ACTN|nr:hypothetical protein [Actinoplanes sandaracinus]MDI6097027.1 hypothetical protein [Actinoplanes sandaracinus]